MDQSSPQSPPGARAIKIPHADQSMTDYPAPMHHRRRRGGRFFKTSESLESSDAGPSSFGSSDQDSSLSWQDLPARPNMDQTHPSKDQRLPHSSTTSPIDSDALSTMSATSISSNRKDKSVLRPSTPPTPPPPSFLPSSPSPLGPSMRLSTSYKSINLNEPPSHHHHHHHHSQSQSHSLYSPAEPPRLITYTKSGQGFTWNDELFLPSYLVSRYTGRGRRKTYDGDFGDDEEVCPVTEIFITDEEAERMMP